MSANEYSARTFKLLIKKNFSVNMVNKQEPTSEFQIQQEDFPALPGAQSLFSRMIFNDRLIASVNYRNS